MIIYDSTRDLIRGFRWITTLCGVLSLHWLSSSLSLMAGFPQGRENREIREKSGYLFINVILVWKNHIWVGQKFWEFFFEISCGNPEAEF